MKNNAVDRKLFMMTGFHHPNGKQQDFLNATAVLYNIIPYQQLTPANAEYRFREEPAFRKLVTQHPNPHFRRFPVSYH